MKEAFTMIELLVTLIILVLVVGVITPKGIKILNSYQNFLKTTKIDQNLSILKANAFLLVKDYNITINDKNYFISKKGVVFETSNDNH